MFPAGTLQFPVPIVFIVKTFAVYIRSYCPAVYTVVAVIHANMLMSGVVEAAYDSHGFQFSHTITTPEDYN